MIWFYQNVFGEVRLIDYFEGSGYAMTDIVRDVVLQKPYAYGTHFLPHDARVHEYVSGKTRLESARKLLGNQVRIVAKLSISDGIDEARKLLARCFIDEERCKKGLAHLSCYAREYDERNQAFLSRPRHDAHSHAADALRYLAIAASNSTQ